jgi:hypothetical protein
MMGRSLIGDGTHRGAQSYHIIIVSIITHLMYSKGMVSTESIAVLSSKEFSKCIDPVW